MRRPSRIRVPGDKSISHRALILSALADGSSRIDRILDAADIRSTAESLRRLGVTIPALSDCITVRGVGRRGLRQPLVDLDCGNSGTTARLLAGVVAGHPFTTRFIGDASLSRRPMHRVATPLAAMGARVELERGDGLPMRITGGDLTSIEWRSDTASAQVKSAILLAGHIAGVRVAVAEPLVSRDHTERMMGARGVSVSAQNGVVELCGGELATLDMTVPGDPSSAAYLAAFAVLAGDGELELVDVCANPTRTGFFDALGDMGADIDLTDGRSEGGEPIATLRVRPAAVRGTTVSPKNVPAMIDELPLLACVAARADGETVIRGAAELRLKESDRIAAVVANLRGLGIDAEEMPDGMRITGSRAPLSGFVSAHGDHRLAMAFGVLAALPDSQITIDEPDCVAVSYPGFWSDLYTLRGQ